MENNNYQDKKDLSLKVHRVVGDLNRLLSEAREQKIPVVLEIGEFEKRMTVSCTVFPRNHPSRVASEQDD